MASTERRNRGPASTVDPAQAPLALVVVGALVGLYAMVPGIYLGGLHVKRVDEVVDHVIPGLVVLAMVGVNMLWGRRSVVVGLVTGVVVAAAGAWMVATHVGLFLQGLRHQAPLGPVAYHCSTAGLALLLGLVWVWRYREALPE